MLEPDEWPNRTGSVIFLEDAHRRIAMRLRDDICYQDYWGLFGGLVEDIARPRDAICARVAEALSFTPDPARLSFMTLVYLPQMKANCHVWHYRVPAGAEQIRPSCRQEIAFFSPEDLHDILIVPYHRGLLEWFWAEKARV